MSNTAQGTSHTCSPKYEQQNTHKKKLTELES